MHDCSAAAPTMAPGVLGVCAAALSACPRLALSGPFCLLCQGNEPKRPNGYPSLKHLSPAGVCPTSACRGSLEDEVSVRMQEVRQAVQDAEAEEAAAGRDDSTGEPPSGARQPHGQRCMGAWEPPWRAAAVPPALRQRLAPASLLSPAWRPSLCARCSACGHPARRLWRPRPGICRPPVSRVGPPCSLPPAAAASPAAPSTHCASVHPRATSSHTLPPSVLQAGPHMVCRVHISCCNLLFHASQTQPTPA